MSAVPCKWLTWEPPKTLLDFVNPDGLGTVEPEGRSMRPMGLFDLPDHLARLSAIPAPTRPPAQAG